MLYEVNNGHLVGQFTNGSTWLWEIEKATGIWGRGSRREEQSGTLKDIRDATD
ncbi:MAG: hypothetical protein JO031_18705 [Ktedonobacteraceae bacterium]|nr:hypothetical protein [Ktedonobacteraceae bacterium]